MSLLSDPGLVTEYARSEAGRSLEPDGAGPLVLVADDDAECRDILLEVLRGAGFRAIGVRDGVELVELSSTIRPSLVIMDLVMPRMDGLEAAAALRSDPETSGIPLVAVTASWLAERADLLSDAGFDAALRKPCSGEQLLEQLRHLLARPRLALEV